MPVPPEQSNGFQALLKETLEEKAGRGKEAPPHTHTWEGQHRQTCVRGRKPLAAPEAQEGFVFVANATGPSWGVKSGCFRAGTVCNC